MFVAVLADLDTLDLAAMKSLVVAQQARLSSRESEIAHLKLLLDKLRRMLFGAKSEKLVRQVEQLELQLKELEAVRASELVSEPAPILKEIPTATQAPLSRALPKHLPREIETHLPEKTCCPDCGGKLRQFGEDVTEMIERVRESFKVIRHVRPKFCCSACETVVEAPAPTRPIARSYAGPGLLAHLVVSKYADHQPLYRQSEIYAREGVELDRSTLAGWVGASSELLAPLVEAVRRHVFAADRLHADDTPVPVLAPGNGKTKTGRLWTYVRDGRPWADAAAPAVWFGFSPDRRGEHPQLPRNAAGRRLRGISSTLRPRTHRRGRLLGACAPEVP